MDKKIISFDLGTGGNKASLYDDGGELPRKHLRSTIRHSIPRLAGTSSVLEIGGMRLLKAPAN